MSESREPYTYHNNRDILEGSERAKYVRVLDPETGRFLFEFDPLRDLIIWRERGKRVEVQLAQYR